MILLAAAAAAVPVAPHVVVAVRRHYLASWSWLRMAALVAVDFGLPLDHVIQLCEPTNVPISAWVDYWRYDLACLINVVSSCSCRVL